MITIQANVKSGSVSYTDLSVIIEKIKTGGSKLDLIKELRGLRESDVEKYKIRKSEMPVVIFQGKFSKRDNESLLEASGLMVLDFDHTGVEFKERLKSIPFIYMAFVSLGGDGVKALVKIPVVKSDAEYKEYWYAVDKALRDRLPEVIDSACKDISRACFFSYDPDVYVNTEAIVFTGRMKKDEKKTTTAEKYVKNDYKRAMVPLNFIRSAVDGERHTKILKASRLMGGYVASGIISDQEAVRLLEQEAYHIDPSDFQVNRRAIIDGIENGKTDPVTDALEAEIKTEQKYGKLYFTLKEVEPDIDEKFKHGISRGYYVGWDALDEFYTLKLGTTTYIYGAPYSGKTILWYEILINCSRFYGMKHIVFSPETGGASDIYIHLIEISTGKNFYSNHGNQLSAGELDEAKRFIDKHFIVVDPDDNMLTVEDFYAYCDIIERKFNTKIHTTTIDPWNELLHDFADKGNRQDIYLEWTLGKIRQNARVNDRHNAIITHITHQQKVKDTNGNFYYPPADFREVSGGQSWARKGMNMLNIYRPPQGLQHDGIIMPDNATIVSVQKVKPRGVGNKGEVILYFDFRSHRFYEEKSGNRIYSRAKRIKSEELQLDFAPLPYVDPEEAPF